MPKIENNLNKILKMGAVSNLNLGKKWIDINSRLAVGKLR
jgi:hypothetical protein